jgi:hypothetical protein
MWYNNDIGERVTPRKGASRHMSTLRVGRWMSRAEYDAMVAAGRVQPTAAGLDMKHVTAPPDPDAFRAAPSGSVFAEFDVVDAQVAPGGHPSWLILYGANSTLGRLAARRGLPAAALPRAANVVVTETS